MVFDSQSPEAERYYSRESLAAFKRDDYLRPPDNTHIWIAPHLGTAFVFRGHLDTST